MTGGMPPFDGRRDRNVVAVTAAANVTSALTLAYLRNGEAVVSVSATLTANLAAGDTLFTMPVGYRPAVTIYGSLINVSGEAAIRVLVAGVTGLVLTEVALLSGSILRGQVVIPI